MHKKDDEYSVESSPLLSSAQVPSDKFRVAYIIFVIQGLGILLPWNAFISANDYFTSMYGSTYVFFISVVFNWSGALCFLLLVKALTRFSFISRVLASLLIFFVILLAIPFIAPMPKHISESVILVGIFLTGLATVIMQSSVAGMAALFPPEYIGGMMTGCGVAGIVAIVLRVITKASLPNTQDGIKESGIVFFILAACVTVLCAVTFIILWRLPVTKYHLSTHKQMQDTANNSNAEKPSFVVIIRKLWKEATVVVTTLFITLSLFPGITGLIKSHNGISQDWFPIIFTAIFLVFDFVGRSLTTWVRIFSPIGLLPPALARLAFFPLFIFCIRPLLIANDWVSCIIMAIYALSNGYFATLAMIYGPQQVSNAEREYSGIVLSGCLTGAIFLGSHFALLLLYLITGSVGI